MRAKVPLHDSAVSSIRMWDATAQADDSFSAMLYVSLSDPLIYSLRMSVSLLIMFIDYFCPSEDQFFLLLRQEEATNARRYIAWFSNHEST